MENLTHSAVLKDKLQNAANKFINKAGIKKKTKFQTQKT